LLREAISAVVSGRNLTEWEAEQAMEAIMTGEATPVQAGALLVALRMKGETVDELTGFARVMQQKVLRVNCRSANLVDTCGTGGDGLSTFNVSTAAAFVVAGAGVPVAKHGNRSMSSRCGSADVLEALGVCIALPPDEVAACVDEVGIGFMFAQTYHPAMRHAAPVRRELGIRTVFNILGPLTNPAGAKRQLIGVPRPELAPQVAEVLARLGSERAMVVYGEPGMDELSTVGPSFVAELRDGDVTTYTLDATALGLPRTALKHVVGSGAAENAAILSRVLAGEMGPARDIVLLNAAAGLVVGGLTSDIREALSLARRSLDSGAAAERLNELRKRTPAQ
jgi:anthranilate phosphoribosyltransferase